MRLQLTITHYMHYHYMHYHYMHYHYMHYHCKFGFKRLSGSSEFVFRISPVLNPAQTSTHTVVCLFYGHASIF